MSVLWGLVRVPANLNILSPAQKQTTLPLLADETSGFIETQIRLHSTACADTDAVWCLTRMLSA